MYKNIIEQMLIPFDIFKSLKSNDLIALKCNNPKCKKISYLEKHYVLAKIKHNKTKACSSECQHSLLKRGEIRECAQCGKEIYRLKSECKKNKSDRIFCSTRCSALFNSPGHITTESQKQKTIKSLKKYHDKKGRKYPIDENGLYIIHCIICGKESRSKKFVGKLCKSPKCALERRRQYGRMGGIKAQQQNYKNNFRSKSERLLFDKIKEIFPDALNNQWIFDGYDADIIIPNLKLAIHWNGPWHYQEIISKEHFEKVKRKDVERYKSIEKHGYKNYIIKDLDGIHNETKVKKELNILLEWIKNNKLVVHETWGVPT